MHSLTFFPLGNADSCLIKLANGKRLLFDFANLKNPAEKEDLRADLAALLVADFGEDETLQFEGCFHSSP